MQNILSGTRTDHPNFDRTVPETLSTSLFYGSSASPPPFARDTRTASISSTGSSHHHRSHPSILNTFASAAAAPAPDPWVEQALVAPPPDVIDLELNPILQDNTIPSTSTQALERSTVIGHSDSPKRAGKEDQVGSDQPVASIKPDPVEATEDGAQSGERVTFSLIYNAVHKAVTTARKDVDPQEEVEAEIKPAENVDADDPIPSPNSPQEIAEVCAQSSLFESLLPPPFSTAATSGPVPITNPSASSNSKSSIVVGSHDSSRMHHLAESTTWEKVEGINDEWQELSNPREDVVAMSESEEDSELDEDDEEWEASRKVNTMADSTFVPSVERRRRLAAAEQLKKQDRADNEGAGSITPRGKRTPTTSFVHNKHPRGVACAYEAYNNGSTTNHPRTPKASSAAQSKLTPQQEQLVAELQRARNTRGVAMPALVPQHQQMNRRVVPLSSDW